MPSWGESLRSGSYDQLMYMYMYLGTRTLQDTQYANDSKDQLCHFTYLLGYYFA